MSASVPRRWSLAAGRWLLAAGRRPVAAGRWPLVPGRWPLVAGCWLLIVGSLLSSAAALEVRLAGPLTTTVDLLADMPPGDALLTAEVAVSDDAPPDLQVAAFALGDDGGWRQSSRFQPLPAGRHSLALPVPGRPGRTGRAIGGLLLCSSSHGGRLRIAGAAATPRLAVGEPRLSDLAWDDVHARTGRPWRMRLRPEINDGIAIAGTATAADGASVDLAVEAPGADGRWHLVFTPPAAGTWRIEASVRWRDGPSIVQRVEVLAAGVAAGPAAPASGGLALAAPLRSEFARPVAEAAAACRVSARLAVPADAPADLAVGAFVRDGDGGWRRSRAVRSLPPGMHVLDLEVPAGGSRGPGEAGLALWSAGPGAARLGLDGLAITAAAPPSGTPGLDRLRLDGVVVRADALEVAVGATWAAAVVPVPDDPGCRIGARIASAGGEPLFVPARRTADGSHRVELHPVVPGSYRVEMVGRWSDGRTLSAALPRLLVAGEHPCPGAAQLSVRGPLTTVVPLPPSRWDGVVEATVLVPDGAPADLAAAAVAIDHDDRWFQAANPQALRPGLNRLRLVLDAGATLAAAPGAARWDASTRAQLRRTGLAITTASATPVRLQLGTVERPVAAAPSATGRLLELASDGPARTGERWTLSLRPDPFPANPYEPDEFRLDLEVVAPDGSRQLLPGFCAADMQGADRGDRESVRQASSLRFDVRWRPRLPGRHRLTLLAAWGGGTVTRTALPEVEVAGERWDGYARVDAKDPRFFAVDGRFIWPNGPNLRSVWDVRARERMRTRLTPDRGSLAYDAYLARYAAAGADACEIWLSAWNLALEWRGDWPGFAGVGRYNQGNAWRLDRILDQAWRRGMRVNLVINNHGQGSERTDAEWASNPYNRARGGRLDQAQQFFHDPWALRGQGRLRRYLIARYADHPAVLGWKLWSEINLTSGGPFLRPWHEQAAQAWRAEDAYDHPVTTHWSSDYRTPDHGIAALMDYICIDAYHGDKPDNPYRLVHRLLRDSTLAEDRGLARLGRPVLVTEFGGNWSGTRDDALMEVDHGCGAWVALVSGHGGGPMLWWFEWIDQGRRFAPYTAIRRFLAGEDLRGGRPLALSADPSGRLWAAGWRTRTGAIGYAIDEDWAEDGTTARPVQAQLSVGGLANGPWTCEWWDPGSGEIVGRAALSHGGGDLRLTPPTFTRHLAWKLRPGP